MRYLVALVACVVLAMCFSSWLEFLAIGLGCLAIMITCALCRRNSDLSVRIDRVDEAMRSVRKIPPEKWLDDGRN